MKKIISTIVILVIICIGGITTTAADTTATGTGSATGNVTINGTIEPLIIKISHPAAVSYAIDPNSGTGGTFISSDIQIENKSNAAVKVTVSDLSATSGGSISFQDVDVSAKTWSELNAADSTSYIALGIRAKNSTGWNTGYSTLTHYAVKSTPSTIGTLPSGATATLALTASHGTAFNNSYTASHNLSFLFDLA